MSSERVACPACGKWMFALAKTCPHCGGAGKPSTTKLEITAEEARSLLATAAPAEPRMKDVAAELVLPRSGFLDLVLSLIALPVTVTTLVVLGWGVLQAMRSKAEVNLRGARLLAVPTSTCLMAVLLLQHDVDSGVWAALVLSLGAWLVRDLIRASARRDALD